MSGSTSKSAWTQFERNIAADLSTLLPDPTTRTPLSGENSRHGPGDVVIPPGLRLLIEAKYRATNNQHALFDGAVSDGLKHGIPRNQIVLATKVKRATGYLITVSDELFWTLMSLPGALDHFRESADDARERKRAARAGRPNHSAKQTAQGVGRTDSRKPPMNTSADKTG